MRTAGLRLIDLAKGGALTSFVYHQISEVEVMDSCILTLFTWKNLSAMVYVCSIKCQHFFWGDCLCRCRKMSSFFMGLMIMHCQIEISV